MFSPDNLNIVVVNFLIQRKVSSVKHPEKDPILAAGEEGEVQVVEIEEEVTNSSKRSNNEEEQ